MNVAPGLNVPSKRTKRIHDASGRLRIDFVTYMYHGYNGFVALYKVGVLMCEIICFEEAICITVGHVSTLMRHCCHATLHVVFFLFSKHASARQLWTAYSCTRTMQWYEVLGDNPRTRSRKTPKHQTFSDRVSRYMRYLLEDGFQILSSPDTRRFITAVSRNLLPKGITPEYTQGRFHTCNTCFLPTPAGSDTPSDLPCEWLTLWVMMPTLECHTQVRIPQKDRHKLARSMELFQVGL